MYGMGSLLWTNGWMVDPIFFPTLGARILIHVPPICRIAVFPSPLFLSFRAGSSALMALFPGGQFN